jgi:hypothetical protein
MARVLVVANETLGGRKLIDAVRERHEGGDAQFYVVAPQNQPRHGNVIYEDSVMAAAQHRVDATLAALRDAGIEARGEVMDPDPYSAITDAVAQFGIDEIILSTHPETRSGWLRRDLVERVEQDTGLPVTHVVVDLDSERQDLVHTLVVANQTADSRPLLEALSRRASEGPHAFTVLIPQEGGAGSAAAEARERLESMLEHMREAGLEATGLTGDPDPFTAIMNALQFYRVDDIVISTHPETRSGWLRADLIERVRRSTAAPVEHIVVDLQSADSPDAAGAGAV